MSGHEARTYIDFTVYGCWLHPATQSVMVCQFQQHLAVMRAHMDQIDPNSKQSVYKWAFANGWIKIENELDANGSQVNLQGFHDTLKRAWPLVRRELLHADHIFIDIKDANRNIHWIKYQDREKIRNFNINEEDESSRAGLFAEMSPCFQC